MVEKKEDEESILPGYSASDAEGIDDDPSHQIVVARQLDDEQTKASRKALRAWMNEMDREE